MKVVIPTQLRSYTRVSEVQAEGSTLDEVLGSLDRQFPGLRFRIIDEQGAIREHIRIFINAEIAQHLNYNLGPNDVIRIIGALSGG